MSSTGTWRRGRDGNIQTLQITSSWLSKVRMGESGCREGGLLVQRFTQKGAPHQSQTLSGLFILLLGDTNQWNENTVRSYGCGSESTRWWKTSGGDGDVTSQWCKLDLVVENCRKIIWKWLDNILPLFALLQIQFVNVLYAFFLYVSNSFLACKRMLAGGTWHKKCLVCILTPQQGSSN